MAVVFHEGLKFCDGDHTDMWLILEIAFIPLVWWQDYQSGFHFHFCGIINRMEEVEKEGQRGSKKEAKKKLALKIVNVTIDNSCNLALRVSMT